LQKVIYMDEIGAYSDFIDQKLLITSARVRLKLMKALIRLTSLRLTGMTFQTATLSRRRF